MTKIETIKTKKKYIFRLFVFLFIIFILLNVIAAFHAYKFTHFSASGTKLENINLTFFEKAKLLFTGVDIPRPQNTKIPNRNYTTVNIQSNVKIECWLLPVDKPLGTVILFHGYTSNKSELIDRAEVFLQNGYNCLLVDFMGSGGSGGNQTTIGFMEAVEVKDCFEYVKNSGEKNIYLLGSSLGAVAIMKAIKEYNIKPASIIVECPFGTMYETVVARFNMLHVPPVPMAGMLLFWGGIENGFLGFSHNPKEYAKSINCPVLLQWGLHDDRVSKKEIDDIYANLNCKKQMIIYTNSGHDNYLKTSRDEWNKNVITFVNNK